MKLVLVDYLYCNKKIIVAVTKLYSTLMGKGYLLVLSCQKLGYKYKARRADEEMGQHKKQVSL